RMRVYQTGNRAGLTRLVKLSARYAVAFLLRCRLFAGTWRISRLRDASLVRIAILARQFAAPASTSPRASPLRRRVPDFARVNCRPRSARDARAGRPRVLPARAPHDPIIPG